MKNWILSIFALLAFLFLVTSASAGTITSCTLDEDWYYPGQSGYATVMIYNDMESKIRVTELSMTIEYYYENDEVYIQTFYTYPDPPVEIESGESRSFRVQFNLPHDIAPGYTTPYVKAYTELWSWQSQSWQWSDHPTYYPTIYIESPYKEQFEEQQDATQDLQEQLAELQAVNTTSTNMMYLLAMTTVGLAVAMMFLILLARRQRGTPTPQYV